MIDYRGGFEYYKEVCERHEIEPVNFHFFIINLSQDQLLAYNDRACQIRGQYEIATP